MDLATYMDMGVIGAILALTSVIKSLDKQEKFTRFYPVIPLVLGIVAAVAKTVPFQWQLALENLIKYVGVSTYIFKFGKTTILNK